MLRSNWSAEQKPHRGSMCFSCRVVAQENYCNGSKKLRSGLHEEAAATAMAGMLQGRP